MSKLKLILIGVFVWVAIVTIPKAIIHFVASNEPNPSVFEMSKDEYVDRAVVNCVKDGQPADVCECFYTNYLKKHSVRETLQFDTAASADPEGYEYTQEQLGLLAKCLE